MIDLRSDTLTKPTDEMREVMFQAEVGDDVYGEDPTVQKLEELAADLLGKEAALFVTSGTQGNQVAVLTHGRPGDEIILEADSHIFYYEGGAASALAGVQTRIVPGQYGQMPVDKIRNAIRDEGDIHLPHTAMIGLENTHNRAGGVILPPQYMKEVYEIAKQKNVPIHLDGARLFNAAVGLDINVKEFTQYVDTVQVCLSKGLSAPMGSILAGPKEWIEVARKWRKRLGGGMRQAGHMAAPGIVALTKMVDRLAEDHRRAKELAKALFEMDGIQVDLETVQTNIVLIDVKETGKTANEWLVELKKSNILGSAFGEYVIRLTTHRHITDQDIRETVDTIHSINKKRSNV